MRTLISAVILLSVAVSTVALLTAGAGRNDSTITGSSLMNDDWYAGEWKKVDEALRKGLPKSALDLVQAIYARARAEKNGAQTIKAVAYRVSLVAETNENGELLLIGDLEKETAAAAQPEKSVLQSMLAEVYWTWYRGHRWEIGQRTVTGEAGGADFRTWDARDFVDTVRSLYLASITQEALLEGLPVERYKDILVRLASETEYRPTMYDILAHRALAFFSNDEADLPRPVQEFAFEGTEALAPAAAFAAHVFSTPDDGSQLYHATLVYQRLLRFHLRDVDPRALVDLDLLRLAWARDKSASEDRDTVHFQRLAELYDAHRSSSISAQAGYAIAQWRFERGDYVEALRICDREIARYGDSRGGANCASLRSHILEKSMDAELEAVVAPGRPFLVSFQFRNIRRVHFRVYRDERDEVEQPYRYRQPTDEWLKVLLKGKPVTAWSQDLPATADYKAHRVDLKGPALKPGSYFLLFSHDAGFAMERNAIGYASFDATHLALQTQQSGDGSLDGWVRFAGTGAAVPGVRVEMSMIRWNSPASRYERVDLGSRQTDAEGAFRVPEGSYEESVNLTLHWNGETWRCPESFYLGSRPPDHARTRTLFFTDRSLYRPGQTVHVKGIILDEDPARLRYEVVPKRRTTVGFYDANGQKVAEQEFTTNGYGSFHGTFTAPAGVLTGIMTIRNEHGSVGIRVEEYKRPKFEVAFEPVKGSFSLGQRIRVTATARAYAGSNVDGAAVSYRVTRQARYPYWCWWWRPMPSSEAKEIAHGTTVTDAAGAFAVEFTAVPDAAVPKKDMPVFTYTVSADVTDINGETHSASSSVAVGYTSVALGVDVAGALAASAPAPLRISTRNLAGEAVEGRGELRVEKLARPARVIRRRLLPEADLPLMTREEFLDAFPDDAWGNEADPDAWPVERSVLRAAFATDAGGSDTVDFTPAEPGSYRITATMTDPAGAELKQERYVTVYEREGGGMPVPEAAMLVPVTVTCAPGDSAELLFGTAFEDARVLYQVIRRGVVLRREWLDFDRELRRFRIPVAEADRGGIAVSFTVLHDYRQYVTPLMIAVPWTNKELRIETATFRDKLLPGQNEEWRITIRGEKADAVAAEMVASLYDASLDAIWQQGWQTFSWPVSWHGPTPAEHGFRAASAVLYEREWNSYLPGRSVDYDELNLFILPHGWGWNRGYGGIYMQKSMDFGEAEDGVMYDRAAMPPPPPAAARSEALQVAGVNESRERKKDGEGEAAPPSEAPGKEGGEGGQIKARTNFNETAFFFPQLRTDDSGAVVLAFTMPEALTRWKLRLFAHTPSLAVGYLERSVVTQKDLMVMPNAPRFLREGDELDFPVKITNMADSTVAGTARLELFDAVTMRPVDAAYKLAGADQRFAIEKGRSASVSWRIAVPYEPGAIVYRVTARAASASDGEEAPLAVLPNRMLVTETLPLNIRGGQTRTVTFEKLLRSASSPTLRHHKLTLEMTSNPAWYAVQALPYIIEYPYECSEQVFNRFYANSIASHLVNSNPKIQRVFEQWKGTDALLSNLQKNQELKSLLLEETPWVMQGKDESERKRRIALLFDLNTMADNLGSAFRKLEKAQGGNGGWPWFPGMPESRYITQYIVAGFGHLRELGVRSEDPRVARMMQAAVAWMDAEMQRDYEELVRRVGKPNPSEDYLDYLEIQYLYARSYFAAREIPASAATAFAFWRDQARRFWVRRELMPQGMLALALHRFGDKRVPADILASLRERAMRSDELGMYWKQNTGWYWYQAPIETQAVLIEAFDVIADDLAAVDEMKIWMLKMKQVQDWRTTIATADACYALLRRGSDLLASDKLVEVKLGDRAVDPFRDGARPEAGTGYFSQAWNAADITPAMGRVTMTKHDAGIAWGALYWQYYEQLDRITPAKTPLQIEKTLYRQTNTDRGIVLEQVTEKNPLRVGDVLKVRIEIRVDRDMEYVHLKDMRGAGLELVSQLSRYRWQGRLGYYEAPKDASVNFFLYWLPKGVHVFEYALRVSHTGTFSNGISTIQCMYAPEFSAHSAGITVRVKG